MANSLDSSTLVNIAKNRSRLLKLADGIRTRKKPGSSKKSLKLDPAYTNIEHLVFGTYRARSATPDSRNENHNHRIKDCTSANSTPTRNGRNDDCHHDSSSNGHFPRRVPYRSSDGSESERSSTVSSTDANAKCECSRHSPSLVITEIAKANSNTVSPNSTHSDRNGGYALYSPMGMAGEKATKCEDEEENIHHVVVSATGGVASTIQASAAPRVEGLRNNSVEYYSTECGETETGLQRLHSRFPAEDMPSTTSTNNPDLRRGPITTRLNRSASGNASNKINSASKELKVQNGSSSSRNKNLRKALSAEESQTSSTGQHLSASSSGVSVGRVGGEDSGYQTSNGSSRRTSWKELSSSNSTPKIPSSHSDSKLQSRTRTISDNTGPATATARLNGLTYGNGGGSSSELPWCNNPPECQEVELSSSHVLIKSEHTINAKTQFERQNSCPSGIPKAKPQSHQSPQVRLAALLTSSPGTTPDSSTSSKQSENSVISVKDTSEDNVIGGGTQAKNATVLRKVGSLPERGTSASKIRYPGMVSGIRNQSFRKATDVETDCAVPDPDSSDKINVTCKIRITPPTRGTNMKGNLSRQISSTGNYKNLISGSAIQAGTKTQKESKSTTGHGHTVKSISSSSKGSSSVNVTRSASGLNGSKSNLNGSRSSLNGSKRDLSSVKGTKGSSTGFKGGSPKTTVPNASSTSTRNNSDVDKCSTTTTEMNRSVKSSRPQQMTSAAITTGHKEAGHGHQMPPTTVSDQNKSSPKMFGLQNSIQKGERQKRPRQQVPVKESNGVSKNNMARWADIRGRNMERTIPDSLSKFVPAEDTHVPAPEPFSLPECNVTTDPKLTNKTTTWAQLGKSRSVDAKSTNSSGNNTTDNCYVPDIRRSSMGGGVGQYYSLDSGSTHLQKDCSSETVVEPVPRRPNNVPDDVENVEELNQVETEAKVVNGVTGIPIPRNKITDAKAIRVMVPMPLPYRLTNKDGPSSLPLPCDDEPSFEIMNETVIGAKVEPKDKPPLPPPSPKTNGSSTTLLQTPPLIGRKRSLSVGSPARHLDLRLLAAFQRYGDVTKELPENPDGVMSDIEEKDENSSSSASRATSEEPQDVFVDGDWSILGGHRVSVVNGTVYRSPVRRRTTGSLGLERLLPIGPPISTPTSSWKGTPSSSPGRDSLSSRDNISVIPCNFDDDISVCSSTKSTPARRNIYRHLGASLNLSADLEHSQNQTSWEKTVTIETGPTNSHLVVGTTGEEISPLVQLRKHQNQNGSDSITDTQQTTSSTTTVPPSIAPYSSLPPSAYRLIRNRPISRSERHLKTTSTPEFRAGSVEAIGGGSVRDVRRPWSEVYGEELDTRTILSQTNPNCFSVPNFPRFGDGSASPSPDTGGNSFFNRFSSIRATDSMLQKFRKTFSLRFQKARKDSTTSNTSPPQTQVTASTPVTSTPVDETPPPLPEVPSPQPPPLPASEPPYDKEASFTNSLPISECSVSGGGGVTGDSSTGTSSNPNSRPSSTVETELGSLWNLQNVSAQPTSVSGTSPGTLGTDSSKDDGLFKLGLSVLRSSRDRKKLRKKDCRSSKCNSADSGIQVEATCPGDGGGVTEPNSATESPAVLRRRAVSTSESSPKNKVSDRPLSDYIDHIDLESVDEVTSLGGGKSVGDVFRESSTSPRSRDNLYCSPVRRTPSIDRQMSTPPPIKLRTERKIRPRIRRQKGKSRLRRSISQPLDLEKMGFAHKGLDHGLSDHEGSRESTASSDEDFSSDNELYHILKSPNRKQNVLKEMYEDTVTYAEALWDHVTIDLEELPFKAGEVIEVTDTGDKDWWWGSIGGRSGWFPAPFVRLRVSQEDTVEDCIIKMADGTLTSRNHAPRKMSISLLSNEQVRANVVREIVTTERDFVQHLRDVVEGYLRQVRRRPDMFLDEVISTIFGNIEAIYSFQSVFLKNLEACINWQSPHISEIGQCFLDHKESFKIYSEYCNNHPLAVSQLQELYSDQKYVQFFEACRLLQDMIDISLDGFLLTPVQKICKYPLQLAELLKYTKPDHPDHRTVTDALAAMRGVAQMVNERKRRMECLEKLVEWQKSIEGWEGPDILETSSVLIHSGEVTRVTSNWSRDITLFLFDHLLVYCKKDLIKRNTAVYKGRIDLNHCCVFDVEDGKDAQFGITLRNAWKIHCSKRDKWFLFYAKSSMEKSRWLQALREERQLGLEDKEQGFIVTNQAKKAAKLAVLNKNKTKRPRAKIPKGSRPHPDTAVVELLLDPPGPKTRSGSLPSNLSPSMVVNGSHNRVMPTKKKGSGWFHFGSGKKSKK